eukprot:403354126
MSKLIKNLKVQQQLGQSNLMTSQQAVKEVSKTEDSFEAIRIEDQLFDIKINDIDPLNFKKKNSNVKKKQAQQVYDDFKPKLNLPRFSLVSSNSKKQSIPNSSRFFQTPTQPTTSHSISQNYDSSKQDTTQNQKPRPRTSIGGQATNYSTNKSQGETQLTNQASSKQSTQQNSEQLSSMKKEVKGLDKIDLLGNLISLMNKYGQRKGKKSQKKEIKFNDKVDQSPLLPQQTQNRSQQIDKVKYNQVQGINGQCISNYDSIRSERSQYQPSQNPSTLKKQSTNKKQKPIKKVKQLRDESLQSQRSSQSCLVKIKLNSGLIDLKDLVEICRDHQDECQSFNQKVRDRSTTYKYQVPLQNLKVKNPQLRSSTAQNQNKTPQQVRKIIEYKRNAVKYNNQQSQNNNLSHSVHNNHSVINNFKIPCQQTQRSSIKLRKQDIKFVRI